MGHVIAPGAAAMRLGWMAPAAPAADLALAALAVECAAAQRATAALCADPTLDAVASDAEALARTLLRELGVYSDLPMAAYCRADHGRT